MHLGTINRVERLLGQQTPGDDVIPGKPRCRDESEAIQKMGQSVFACCAAPTCAATLSEIEQSYMRV